jgi:XTP/dITP diphosphohydrolase
MPLLLIASNNPDKINEIRELLKGLPVELKSLRDFPDLKPTLEDRDTIEGNAAKKALEAAQQTGLLCLADDTGLFIEALDGQPGVFAARFAGEGCSYRDNRLKALRLLADKDDRRAEFRTAVALAEPEGVIAMKLGRVRGIITSGERGSNGFGYDAVFEVEATGRTYAEMSDAEKNSLSHRALALRQMLPVLGEVLRTQDDWFE